MTVPMPRPVPSRDEATWVTRTWVTAMTLVLAGCAGNASHITQGATQRPVSPSAAIRVLYEGPSRTHAELVADGPDHVRYAIRSEGYAPMLFVYDGRRLLVHDPEEYRPWQLYDAPQEHPDQYDVVAGVFSTPGSARFAKSCPAATVVGHQTILRRQAVGYHCAAQHDSDGGSMGAYVVWLDQATGVMLKEGPFRASEFDERSRASEATFDTEPPAGAEVEHYAAQGVSKPAPGFTLPNVRATGPRTYSLADYAHRRLVLAFFSSDLTFAREDFPRETGSLRTLESLTSGGTHPVVLGIQEGEEGKPGYPLIPKGLDIAVVHDAGADVQHAYGLGNLVGYAFIGSDGAVQQVFDEPPSEQQLQAALRKLQ